MHTRRKDRDWTVGMQGNAKPLWDFSFTVPDNQIVGCAASCGDQKYPDKPLGDEQVVPITEPPNPGKKTRPDVSIDSNPL